MNTATLLKITIALPLVAMLALAGCGGGGGGGGGSSDTGVPVTTPPEPEPTPSPSETISWSDLIEGGTIEPGTYMVSGVPEEASDQFENGTYDLDAGESIEIGDLNLTCAEGGEACAFVVMDTTVMSSGGNIMTSSVTPPEPPVNAETERLNAALQRAQAAENAAWSSAAQASLQCQAVPAACQAAQDATTAALLAEGANERAQNAMTAAEAERAADVAEQGASRAATAAADAVRLAAAGPGQPPEPPTTGTNDWLFPGTVASAEAGSAAKRAVEDVYPGGGGREDRFKVVEERNGYGEGFAPTPHQDVDVSTYEYYGRLSYVGSWGYWNHPSMPDNITYVQEVFNDDPTYPAILPRYKRVLGLMDNGYFGIGYGDAQDFQSNGSWEVGFSSFYSTNGELSQLLGHRNHNRYTGTPNIGGATWSGSAFGIEIASQTPVFGPSTLTFDGSFSSGGFGLDRARLLLDVDWNNGEAIQISAEAFVNENGTTLFAEDFMTSTGDFFRDRRTFRGSFAGENAEEAFGVFDSQGYIGAFGAKRQ